MGVKARVTPTQMAGGNRQPSVTGRAGGNRVTQLDFGLLQVGDLVRIQTNVSNWYFARLQRSTVGREQITGIMVMTDSRKFGQTTDSPATYTMDRVIRLGYSVFLGRGGNTGEPEHIWVNGELITT